MTSLTWQLFVSFAKVGCVSFGGGPAAIPLLQRELVGTALLTPVEFTEALALSSSLPGPIISNMAVFAGLKLGGAAAAAAAVAGALLPSAALMAGATGLFMKYRDLKRLPGMLAAIRPLVIALLAATLLDIAPAGLGSADQWVIFAVTLALMVRFKLHPGWVIVGAGAAGALVHMAGLMP
jgi:chromate transporter